MKASNPPRLVPRLSLLALLLGLSCGRPEGASNDNWYDGYADGAKPAKPAQWDISFGSDGFDLQCFDSNGSTSNVTVVASVRDSLGIPKAGVVVSCYMNPQSSEVGIEGEQTKNTDKYGTVAHNVFLKCPTTEGKKNGGSFYCVSGGARSLKPLSLTIEHKKPQN